MTSQHHHGDEFWGAQRDWTDSQPRQRPRTGLTARLRTGVNAVLDAGATARRAHGESGDTPVVAATPMADPDLDEWALPAPSTDRAAKALSIGELAMPWEPGVHESTMPVERIDATSAEPSAEATAHHDAVDMEQPPTRESDLLIDDRNPPTDGDATDWGPEWAPVTRRVPPRGGVDPLLAKLGAVVVVLTLAVSFVLSTRDDGDDRIVGAAESSSEVASGANDESAAKSSTTETAASAEKPKKSSRSKSSGKSKKSDDAASNSTGGAGKATTAPKAAAEVSSAAADEPAAKSARPDVKNAALTEPEPCVKEYEVAEGDYWLRLADSAGVSMGSLLGANGATTETALYPGRTICLPAGAATPSPPPATTAAPTTVATTTPATTAAPTTPAPTTAAPTTPAPTTAPATTAAPTTQPAPATPAGPADVERIIRAVWPDQLEDRALEIAWRESNHRPEVRNYCCYGLFQIYWSVHQSWLSGMGITSADHLYDPETNARAAYALYQRAGGWGPWGG